MNNIQISKNFKLKEFQCKGYGQVKIERELLDKLQKLRDLTNKPIIITSGYRSFEYNKKVNGASNSQHLYGRAVDIKIDGITPVNLSKIAEKVGFNGIGIYKTFLHLDIRAKKTKWNG